MLLFGSLAFIVFHQESFAWTTGERDAASHRRHERLQARRPRRLLRQVRRCLRAGSLVRGIAKL